MARLTVAVLVAVLLTGCVPSRPAPATTTTIVETRTHTRPASTSPVSSYTPPPARTVAPLPPGSRPESGEAEKPCPYVRSSQDEGPDSVADIVGSHVLRTTVVTTSEPAGCRFYFYAPPYQAIADIVPRTFASPEVAYDALLATAAAGSNSSGHRDLVPGVDAVLYRTRFFGPDAARDWACAFAAGRVLVVVHTQRDDTSFSALRLAQVVARSFD